MAGDNTFHTRNDSEGILYNGGSISLVWSVGLGLSICHTIVENHGGKMRAESRLNEGFVLSFDLPLANELGYEKYQCDRKRNKCAVRSGDPVRG